MLRSTFLGYKTATGALKTNQYLLDVVGQNISNINTQGYTRQRLDINSVSFNSTNIKFGTSGVAIGQGVEAKGVSQFRDSFLDLRYRLEASKTGSENVQLQALKDLESIFDEITMDGLDAQFSDFLKQLHSLTSSPSDPVLEGVVRTSAQMLTQMFNNYSKEIDTIREQQLTYLEKGAVVKINQLTENIAKLNKQIRESNISGNPALELNDERNLLVDELSSYLDIEVDIKPLGIGGGKSIDELVVKLRGTEIELVNRNFSNTVNISNEDTDITINITHLEKDSETGAVIINSDGSPKYIDDKNITSSITGGQINGYLKFLNGKGEFAESEDKFENTKGVQYYQNMLDTLANKFAEIMNKENMVLIIDEDNNPVLDSDGNYTYKERDLFATRDGSVTITAGNIKISDDWAKATDSYITNTKLPPNGDNKGATDNILKMINRFQKPEDYIANIAFSNDDGAIEVIKKPLFKGTFQEFLSYTTTKLNLQVEGTETSFYTYSETQFHIDYARSSMSSVDLNEEGINLLQYSKSYNAAARLMTTLDEMLDTLINRMGV